MNRQQAKALGENIGIFFVCIGLLMMWMPLMRILVKIAEIITY
jgi:hypothetical protein